MRRGAKDGGGYGFAIYEVAGDEGRAFLYTVLRRFYFGGKDGRLGMRAAVFLDPPTVEMASSVTVVLDDGGSPRLRWTLQL